MGRVHCVDDRQVAKSTSIRRFSGRTGRPPFPADAFEKAVPKDQDGELKFKEVAEAYRTLKRPDLKVAYDHQINNICADEVVLTISDPGIEYFNWGLALFQYFSWFWLNRIRNGD